MFKLELGTVLPKLRFQLDLIGSNLDRGFPSCKKLDISHWRLPPSALTPFSLPYDEIRVKDIQLPSFTGVDKYVRHFAQAHNIMFFDLTWNTSNRQESPISSYREGSHTVEDRSLDVSAKGCTDNLSLCLLLVVAETHPCWQSLLCMLPDDESQQIAIMIRWFGELADPKKSQKPLISVIGAYFYPNCSLHFQLYNLTAENARASDFRVVGVALKVDEREEEVDIDDLRGYLGLFSTLYRGLLAALGRHRPLSFNPQPVNDQSCKYVFTYRRRSDDEFPEVARLGVDYGSSDYDCVEIDPITLSPTGRSWARSFDFHSSLIQESLRKTGHIPPASI
ncbi:hypothetical protein BDY19DRAFT_910743 [Irpex rosettiformis]|uniref:Uncharacterized protein n=1 Tax=Irpex rosettiformis TaxID=378272 RepID=A0ACB8TML8_9APHY|nr:hypothetical protein BDY19DRAFT_910743 [Irpex rosettiformis]